MNFRTMPTTTTTFLVSLLITLIFSNASSLTTTLRADPPARFLKKQFKTVFGKRMAYVEVGSGRPIVFLHGNPTSSYLWRNVLPHLEDRGRLIAPDLIGMGDSDKLESSDMNRYSFLNHSRFLFELFDQLGVKEKVTFVIHDWGSALGFLWAYNNRANPNAVNGIAFSEAIVAPFDSFDDFPQNIAEFFKQLRSPAGENLILRDNLFVEQVLPGAILRNLTEKEFAEYRRPYLSPGEDRRPTLTWPRQLPIADEPADVAGLVNSYSKWLATSKIPKLFVKGQPGLLTPFNEKIVEEWPNLEEVTVKGIHYLQEDSPDEIAKAIANWLP